MKYSNATQLLPEKLLTEIQKYVQGETIYIPKREATYKQWGAVSGERSRLDERNALIRAAFHNGTSIKQLAQQHFLSTETIKKIVYSRKA